MLAPEHAIAQMRMFMGGRLSNEVPGRKACEVIVKFLALYAEKPA